MPGGRTPRPMHSVLAVVFGILSLLNNFTAIIIITTIKPITPTTMPAIAPADIPLLLLTSALSSLSFGISVLPGARVPVNKMKKGPTITICPY